MHGLFNYFLSREVRSYNGGLSGRVKRGVKRLVESLKRVKHDKKNDLHIKTLPSSHLLTKTSSSLTCLLEFVNYSPNKSHSLIEYACYDSIVLLCMFVVSSINIDVVLM